MRALSLGTRGETRKSTASTLLSYMLWRVELRVSFAALMGTMRIFFVSEEWLWQVKLMQTGNTKKRCRGWGRSMKIPATACSVVCLEESGRNFGVYPIYSPEDLLRT